MDVEFKTLTEPSDLREFYTRVLVPSFPPGELVTEHELLESAANGYVNVMGALADGQIVAGAVGSTPTQEKVMMLVYLALRPGLRGGGVGGRLMNRAFAAWRETYNPTFILSEVEHPLYHAVSEAHGDPGARLRFYARHGGRILDIPYFQPAIRAGEPPVPALMLLSMYTAPEAFVGADHVISWPLRAALRRELVETCAPDFAPAIRVEESLAAEVVRLWDASELDRVPVGLFD